MASFEIPDPLKGFVPPRYMSDSVCNDPYCYTCNPKAPKLEPDTKILKKKSKPYYPSSLDLNMQWLEEASDKALKADDDVWLESMKPPYPVTVGEEPTKAPSPFYEISPGVKIRKPSAKYVNAIEKRAKKIITAMADNGFFCGKILIDEARWLKLAAYVEKKSPMRIGNCELIPLKMKKGAKFFKVLPELPAYAKWTVFEKKTNKRRAKESKHGKVEIPPIL